MILIEEAPERMLDLLDGAERHYGRRLLSLGDRVSRRWLMRNDNPYLSEINAMAEIIGRAGVYSLNLSYEWACTTGAGPDPHGPGNRMLRTLDWPLDGLGRNLVVARMEAAAGSHYGVTWPGFAGLVTAMAPGRFSAAINQPPLAKISGMKAVDWALGRMGMLVRGGLPPSHLLRRVFEECRDYASARDMLMQTRISLPAFFTLSGVEPGQCCIIERDEYFCQVHDGPGVIANHWLELRQGGHSRGWDSRGRRECLLTHMENNAADFDAWVMPPVLNPTTRLAVAANAARRTLHVRGYEADGRATADFSLG